MIATSTRIIGTALIESLVQSVAVSHLVRGHQRASLLLLAAPESGKTTIAKTGTAAHVCPVAAISGRSVLRELHDHPTTEFLLFNDLSSVRAMSATAVNLLVVLLNQITQDERGIVAFAGKETQMIDRQIGIIGCLPFRTFTDHRARWKELGFVSRMIPFAYEYPIDLIAEIKDLIDSERHNIRVSTARAKKLATTPRVITMPKDITRSVRHLADLRAESLGQIGIRLLRHYHVLIRAHALLHRRSSVIGRDLEFLRAVDRHVSITECRPLARIEDI